MQPVHGESENVLPVLVPVVGHINDLAHEKNAEPADLPAIEGGMGVSLRRVQRIERNAAVPDLDNESVRVVLAESDPDFPRFLRVGVTDDVYKDLLDRELELAGGVIIEALPPYLSRFSFPAPGVSRRMISFIRSSIHFW
jgi:hypothetical protein